MPCSKISARGHEAYLEGGIAAVTTAAGADPKLDGIREAFS